MTEKFRIQVPADGVGGTIIRARYLAQRVTEDETREHIRGLEAALAQIASRKPIVHAAPSDAPASKINRRRNDDYSLSEKAIVDQALDLSSNPRPLSLQPRLPGRSVQWISAKLHQEMRARAQNSAPLSAGAGEAAGRASQAVPTRPPDGRDLALGNDEGRPASTSRALAPPLPTTSVSEIARLREELAAKDDQLASKDELIERLRRAQNTAPARTQAWGLTPGATHMPDLGPIPWPDDKQKMRGR